MRKRSGLRGDYWSPDHTVDGNYLSHRMSPQRKRMRQPSGGKTMREPSGGGTMSKPSGGKTMRKPSDGGTMRKSSGLPDNIGTAKHMRKSFEAKKKEERRDNSETVKAYSIQKKD
jgi:hypothetical protein